MGKKRTALINSCLGGSLALILAGCMGQTGNLKPDTAVSQKTQPVQESTESISTARHQVVAASDQQTELDNTLATAEDIALNDQSDDATDDPAEEPDSAVDDPTAEEDSAIGNAVFGAAKDMLDKSALDEEVIHKGSSIWPRIRAGLTLPDRDHPRVQPDRDWFTNHQAYLDRTFTRAAPYLYYIAEEVQARKMPMEIALLPVVESAYQPFAYSHSRAAGIWQFIPGTANLYGLKINWWYDGRRDINASTNAALTYLQKLHDQFNGDWLLALAAYNSGEGTVTRAIAENEKRGLGTRFWDLDLPAETRSYVPRLLAIADIIDMPEKFGLTIRNIPDKPMLKAVNIGAQLDLAIAADMAGLTLDELYTLNPGFNRWATAPNGPHRLLLPLEKVDAFKAKLAALPTSERMRWARHEVKRGESLGKIAKQYGITVASIQRANKINGKFVHAGQALMIPTASRANQEYLLSADQRLETKQSTPKGSEKTLYTVRGGDTLWNISSRHKVEVRSLAAWNDMAPSDTLRLGQKLVIWKGSKQSTTRLSRAERSNSSPIQKVKYRVRSGDSLARISEKFKVSVRDLREWNPDVRGKRIQPGQQLVVFVDVNKVAENG